MSISYDYLREKLLKEAKKYQVHERRGVGLAGWCREHNVSNSRVSEFLSGVREPTTDILAALGYERAIAKIQKRVTK